MCVCVYILKIMNSENYQTNLEVNLHHSVRPHFTLASCERGDPWGPGVLGAPSEGKARLPLKG